jgi:hypothetical protein
MIHRKNVESLGGSNLRGVRSTFEVHNECDYSGDAKMIHRKNGALLGGSNVLGFKELKILSKFTTNAIFSSDAKSSENI